MRYPWILSMAVAVVATVGVALLLSLMPAAPRGLEAPAVLAAPPAAAPLHIAVMPAGDVFDQHRRLRRLAEHIRARLGRPVEIVMPVSDDALLRDLAAGRLDAAILDSRRTVLALDACPTPALLRPVPATGPGLVRGTIFNRTDGDIAALDDLGGGTLALVPRTTAGDLQGRAALERRGLLDPPAPVKLLALDRPEQVITAVLEGRADAGAVSDLVLDAFLAGPGAAAPPLRRLFTGEAVPAVTIVVPAGEVEAALTAALRAMDDSDDGRAVLAELGAARIIDGDALDHAPTRLLMESRARSDAMARRDRGEAR